MSFLPVARFIWGALRPILTFGVTLPLWVLLAAGIWLHVDKTSAVRSAVNDAAAKMVAGGQIAALQAQITEERRIRAWSDGKATEASRIASEERSARADLAVRLALTNDEKEGLANDLAEIQSRPCVGYCVVDDLLFGRLHNK